SLGLQVCPGLQPGDRKLSHRCSALQRDSERLQPCAPADPTNHPGVLRRARASHPRCIYQRPQETPLTMATAHILVVDDEPLMREFVQEVLTRAGHDVTAVSGGRDAV